MNTVYFDPYSSVLSTLQLMQFNTVGLIHRDIVSLYHSACVCVHGHGALLVAKINPHCC